MVAGTPRPWYASLLGKLGLGRAGAIDVARTVRDFNVLYYDGPDGRNLYLTTTWLGVPTRKCPLDTWVYQEILHRTRPEVIVETGVNCGGSTLYLATLCDLLGGGEVLAVDITLGGVAPAVRAHPRVRLFEGSSTDPAVVAAITGRCAGRRTMVILDSDHAAPHVIAELRAYGPLVTPGCYLICEDTNINGHPALPDFGPGPYEAVQTFLSESPGWQVDRDCERLLATFNPGGYLRRVG
jgi:cephalosporin hydroxylase